MNKVIHEKFLKHFEPTFLIIFILLLIFGCYVMYWYYQQDKKQETIYAVCEKILYTGRRYDRWRTIYNVCELGYDYDGAHYIGIAELNYIKVGDKVRIKVATQNPSQFIIPPNEFSLVIAMIVIPIVMVIMVIFFWDSKWPNYPENTEERIK